MSEDVLERELRRMRELTDKVESNLERIERAEANPFAGAFGNYMPRTTRAGGPWDESKHPRGADGKFGSGGGGGAKADHGKAGLNAAKQPTLGGEVVVHPSGIPVRPADMTADQHGNLADYHEKMSEWSSKMGRANDAAGHAAIAEKHRTAEAKKLPIKVVDSTHPETSTKHGIIVDESKLPPGHTPAEHRKIAEDFIAMHKREFPKALSELESVATPGAKVTGRTKNVDNALEKIARKPHYKDASQLGDGTGMRIVAKDIADVKKNVEAIRKHYGDRIVEENDYISTPQPPWGYRSFHFNVKGPAGQLMEVQVRTPNESRWADWAHDTIYKAEAHGKADVLEQHRAEVEKYANAMSDWFYRQDMHQRNTPRPVAPPAVKKNFGEP